MKKIIFALVSSVALLTAASASVAQSSKSGSTVQGFIATSSDKSPKGTVLGIVATTADKPEDSSYTFVDRLMKLITSNEREVDERAVLEPVLYSYFARIKRNSCAEIPAIGSIVGQDPPTFRRYQVLVLRDDDKTAQVNVSSQNKDASGVESLELAFQLRRISGSWKISDVCSTEKTSTTGTTHYCYRSEVKNWKC